MIKYIDTGDDSTTASDFESAFEAKAAGLEDSVGVARASDGT